MSVRHFLTMRDFDRAELLQLLDRAAELKRLRGTPAHPKPLADKSVAIVLEKASTRTRISFHVAAAELGAHAMPMTSKDLQIGRGEPLEDTARIFSRYVHCFVLRTFGHERVETLAKYATIPVINALTDEYHPCQLLADLMTVREARQGKLEGMRVAWVGDGNNMANCWMESAAIFGFELVLACPASHRPSAEIIARAKGQSAANITFTEDVDAAIAGSDVVTTDVWASMGQEDEAIERQRIFKNYIVTAARMTRAKKDAIFLHCLPAHRGEEVEAAVIDGPQSRVWDEAENRLHTQKALLETLLRV